VKQRLYCKRFFSDEDIKAALVEEWDKITLEEICKQIGSMLERCKALRDTKGRPIKCTL